MAGKTHLSWFLQSKLMMKFPKAFLENLVLDLDLSSWGILLHHGRSPPFGIRENMTKSTMGYEGFSTPEN
jgi:hypothetical protein